MFNRGNRAVKPAGEGIGDHVEFGAHLPLLTWGDEEPASIAFLTEYAKLADQLGFTWLTANDHVVYGHPWLDGPVALASVLPSTGAMAVATTVALPVVRGPGPLAKALGAIDRFSGGRLVIGVGPGSSELDYRAVGIPWEERWPRFEEAVLALRALLRPGGPAFEGAFYSTAGMELLPGPLQADGPPIWIGSWGSNAGLRRVARLADGWLASGYNTTPEAFGDARHGLVEHLRAVGSDPNGFPNAVASMFMHVTEDATAADAVLTGMIAPALRRPPEQLRERLLVGPAGECAEKLVGYRAAGAERVIVWPVGDALRQVERFHEAVLPRLDPR
jgi:alkanesulfonate monooxygenase SsuD/methylene tetrahydromethanopterin reductase-like flavin-dependent oxidoreductase (luciferase family)